MEGTNELKSRFRLKRPIVVGAILAIIGIFAIYFFATSATPHAIQEQKNANDNYNSWLADNCACVERNNAFCNEGYELKENVCVNETLKTFTSAVKGCSKYDCSGTNVTLVNKAWEPKLNTNTNK